MSRSIVSLILAAPLYVILTKSDNYIFVIFVVLLQILAGLNFAIHTKKEKKRIMNERKML